jgi:hypothetical protein
MAKNKDLISKKALLNKLKHLKKREGLNYTIDYYQLCYVIQHMKKNV